MHRVYLIIVSAVLFVRCADEAKSKFQRGKELEVQQIYQSAIAVYDSIIEYHPESPWSDSAQNIIEQLTSFGFISKTVMDRMNRGASAKVAASDFEGLQVQWNAEPGMICWGLSRHNPPVEFKVGRLGFYGLQSYGLDRLKFLLFCERNEGKYVKVEGRIVGASDWPGTPLIIEVEGLSVLNHEDGGTTKGFDRFRKLLDNE